MAFVNKNTCNIINRKINFSSNIPHKLNFIVGNKEQIVIDNSNIIINDDLFLNDKIYADGTYISNIRWENIIISSNLITNISNSITSNILSIQNYINSNSICNNLSFLISSNNLKDQNYINSNSIQDILSFLISSNKLKDQNYINSNSIIDNLSFLISSNVLSKQKYINSNSIQDILSFLISSNNLKDQNYINSNSIIDNLSFLISSNVLSKQNYINSNSITDIISPYISSNYLTTNYINISNNTINIGNINSSNYNFNIYGYTNLNGLIINGISNIYQSISSNDINMSTKSGDIIFMPCNREVMRITSDGNVGVKINIPSFPLHVGHSTISSNLENEIYLNGGSLNVRTSTAIVCAKFEDSIWTNGSLYYTSDRRIKKNITPLTDCYALDTIMNLQPVKFNYIDKDYNIKLSEPIYGFISQDVGKYIPEAVIYQENFIPNIYDNGFIDENNIITLETSNIEDYITSNDIIKINDNNYIINNIISSNQFSIINNDNNISSNIFVYGTKINDFNILNKNYIFTLNIAATKQIYHIISSNLCNTKTKVLSYINSNATNIDILSSNINELNNKISYLMNVINDLKTSNNLI